MSHARAMGFAWGIMAGGLLIGGVATGSWPIAAVAIIPFFCNWAHRDTH